jgi:hypothetical protein
MSNKSYNTLNSIVFKNQTYKVGDEVTTPDYNTGYITEIQDVKGYNNEQKQYTNVAVKVNCIKKYELSDLLLVSAIRGRGGRRKSRRKSRKSKPRR